MGLAVGDFDGDLDLDIHITDKVTDSKLLRNNNDGTFTEVGTQTGLDFAGGFGWGTNFFDMDLDGDEDLYISSILYPAFGLTAYPSAMNINNNNNNGAFSNYNIVGDTLFSISNVLGDYNKDRLTDIAVHNSGNTPSVIWTNENTPTNSAVSIKLEGCASNRDGIGATMHTFTNGVPRLYSFHASQSFLGQSSSTIIVPVVNAATIDSLKVKWPSGAITSLHEVNPNQTIVVSECAAPSPAPVILVPEYETHNLTLCDSDSILLVVDGDYTNVLWSNGESNDSIYVNSAGAYTVSVVNQFSILGTSSPVSILHIESPEYSIQSETASCFNNGSIQVVPSDSNQIYEYAWSNNSTSNYLSNLNTGNYYLTVTNEGECAIFDSVLISGPTNFTPIRFNGTAENAICYDDSSGMIYVVPSGGSAPYQFLWSTLDTLATINVPYGNYTLTVTDSYNCQTDTSFQIDQPDQILAFIDVVPDTNSAGKGMISLDVFGGFPPYSIVWNDAQIQTGNVVMNLTQGSYTVLITDANNCERLINIYVQNINLTGTIEIQNEECELICTNQASSILVQLPDRCHQTFSSEEMNIFNIQGMPIIFKSRQISATKKEIFTDEQGVFLIRDNTGRSCKVLRIKPF
jgi:hypothetical protein